MPGSSLTGTASTGNAAGFTSPFNFYINSDTVDTTTSGYGNLIGMSFLHKLSTGFTGGREALQSYLYVGGTPGTAESATGLASFEAINNVNANLGGTSTAFASTAGNVFGGNSNVFTTASATYLAEIASHEFDVTLASGASAAEKFGITIVQGNTDAVQGTYDDAAIEINSSTAPTTWLCGVCFGGYSHQWPFGTSSTLIKAQQRQVPSTNSPAAGTGIDFSAVAFSNYFLKSAGFTVDGSGNVIGNSLNSTPVGNTTASTGAFTILSASSAVSGSGFSTYLASPPAIGGTAAAAGSFTTLSASSTVSGIGFSTYLASPPAIGGTSPAAVTTNQFKIGGNISVASGVGSGMGMLTSSPVYTDSSGAGGTISEALIFDLPQPTLETTTTTTYTNVTTWNIPAPTCSTGGGGTPTCGNLWSLTSGGAARFLGQITGTSGMNIFGGTVSLNASSNSAVNIATGTSSGLITVGNSSNTGKTVLAGIATGTNADFLCLSSGGIVLLQSSSCTISSLRFKEDVNPFTGDALSELQQLDVESFKMKPSTVCEPRTIGKVTTQVCHEEMNRDSNGNREQIGIIAESVAKVEPKCAIYEDDMTTPKSYRPECITALLVAAAQEHVTDVRRQFELIYLLFGITGLLALHGAHLHLKVRKLHKAQG
jgi:hypothetical protein